MSGESGAARGVAAAHQTKLFLWRGLLTVTDGLLVCSLRICFSSVTAQAY